MKLTLHRNPSSDKSTIGKLEVDGVFEAYTLEDVVRDKKVFGQTAIPTGTYDIQITMSPHFARMLPLLINVPNYEGVRIHSGNDAADTEGCILVGDSQGTDFIGSSRVAFERLFAKMQDAIADGDKITIEIS